MDNDHNFAYKFKWILSLKKYTFNLLSFAVLNLVLLLTLLFLFQSSYVALKNFCILGNQIPKDGVLYKPHLDSIKFCI